MSRIIIKGAGYLKEYAALHLAVIIAPQPLRAEQPTSQASAGEALPSVCRVCFNCDLIWIGLFKYYFGGAIFVPQFDLHKHLDESRRTCVPLS